MTEVLRIALGYAKLGWPVFFISRSPKKVPLKGSHSFKEASTDPAALEALHALYCPDGRANVALACGELLAFDPDGDAGLAKWRALGDANGGWPRTLTHRTPRGGYHFIYRSPDPAMGGFNEPRPKGAPGLDVKARGGYIALPPSHTRKGQYTVEFALPIADLPSWAKDWIERKGDLSRPPVHAAPRVDLGDRPAWLTSSSASLSDRAVAGLAFVWSTAEEARFRAALAYIPINGMGYDDFLVIGFGCHALKWFTSDGESLGLKIWHDWARKTPYYKPEGLDAKWQSFERSTYTGRKIGPGTIYHMARAAGWDGTVPYPVPVIDAPVTPEFPKQINGNHTVFADAASGNDPIVFPDKEKGGRPKPSCRNARAAIRALGITCEHDTFHNKMMVGGKVIDQWAGELSDDAVQMLRVVVERHFGFDPGLQHAHDAAIQECLQAPFDPVADYLADLRWDGVPRVAQWLTTYMGASDTLLTRNIAGLALVAAVRRARAPGTKFDQIIVLESPEGRGKSTAIEILAGADNFSDQLILTLDDKGQQEAVQGVWLYEIGDLAGMGRADVERVKAFASRKVDRARPAYGRARVDRARRCVFFATTNDDTYLLSQTGNRRFWPVRVGRIDLDALARDRDQLWAEAIGYEARGIPLVLPESLWPGASAEQEARQVHDAWIDALQHVVGKILPENPNEHRVTTYELFSAHLGLGADRISPTMAKRLGYVMRRLGWHGPKVFKVGRNTPARGYFKPVDASD